MTEMLTMVQAQRLSGLSKTTIQNACRAGVLTWEKIPTGRMPTYIIDSASFASWLDKRAPKPPRKVWSEADLAGLVEMYRSGSSYKQMAGFFGRAASAVQSKVYALGLTKGGTRLSPVRSPFAIPKTGVLVARTCKGCDEMRDANQYTAQSNGSKHPQCKRCHCRRAKASRVHQNYPALLKRLQEVTKARAHNDGKPYTDNDIRVLKDLTRNNLDVAFDLGRTIQAVQARRTLIGAVKKPRGPREADRPALWRLDIAIEERAVVEYFRRVGEPVPEHLYEWNDDERIAS